MAETITSKPGIRLGRATVARGRTVAAPHPTKRVFVGRSPETGAEITGPKLVEFGPGQEIELPIDDITELRALGFLVDPGAVQHQVASGPNFDVTGV